MGDGLPPLLISMAKDPESSPLHQSKWIGWCTRHVEMLPWWRELIKIPGHKDYQGFAQKVCTSFEVPKTCNWVKRVDNDHTPPLVHPLIGKYQFLLTQGLALRTTNSPNHTIPLPT